MHWSSRLLTLEYGTDRLSRKVGNYHLRCVTSHKSKDLTQRRKPEISDTSMFYLLLRSNIVQYLYLFQKTPLTGVKRPARDVDHPPHLASR